MGEAKFMEQLKKGPVPIGENDRNGNEIKQFDFLKFNERDIVPEDEVMYEEDQVVCVLFSALTGDYVGMHEEGHWVEKDMFSKMEIASEEEVERIREE